jgi:hypothetical protein
MKLIHKNIIQIGKRRISHIAKRLHYNIDFATGQRTYLLRWMYSGSCLTLNQIR